MTTVLVWVLIVLIGDRLRLRPPRRRLTVDTCRSVSNGTRNVGLGRGWLAPSRLMAHSTGVAPGPEHVAAWCDGLAGAVRGGSTLSAAIGEVDPPSSCTATVETIRLALHRGASLRQACAIDSCPAQLDVALTVIRACAGHGGSAAEPLSRTAATLRGRAADAAERRTQSAQARMSAVVMTILPVCMLSLLLLTSGSVRMFVGSPDGFGVVVIGAALNVAGWRWMRHLIGNGLR